MNNITTSTPKKNTHIITTTTPNNNIKPYNMIDNNYQPLVKEVGNDNRIYQRFGHNKAGVGISIPIFVPSRAFSGLQAETEGRCKRYGCYCWSKDVLPIDVKGIEQLLGITSSIRNAEDCHDNSHNSNNNNINNNNNNNNNIKSIYPLSVHQSTPLRVLHRRSSAIRIKTIIQLKVEERIDNHHFRMTLITDAGTYVKEFVNGDLGRSIPSVASMLNCRTDLLELDCEGVGV